MSSQGLLSSIICLEDREAALTVFASSMIFETQ